MFAYHCSRMLSGRRRRSRFSRRDPAEKETSSQPSTAFLSNALAALVLPQEEVMCCFPRARLIMSLGDYDFPKNKNKKNTRKGLAMRLSSGIARWWRSPGAAHAVSREGGEGEERAPRARRTAAGGRPGRTALRNVPPGSCAESFSRGGGASNAGRPPPSSALNTGLHMK